jgi:hypothetical protein
MNLAQHTTNYVTKRCASIILAICASLPFSCCAPLQPISDENIQVSITNWHDNHRAAISITHDAGWVSAETVGRVNALVVEQNLHLGYEMVTSTFREYPELLTYARNSMSNRYFSFFGHGDTHINHDALGYDSALASFTKCAETMKNFGFRPIAYAYPHGAGFLPETQRALANAGFLSARGFSFEKGEASLIMPDSTRLPKNWYLLPSLVMQDIAFEGCDSCINSNAELVPYLDAAIRRGAWLTNTYHAIGDDKGWGYYKFSEFQADLASIKMRDFWCASLEDVTLYIRERANTRIQTTMLKTVNTSFGASSTKGVEITLSDNLDNTLFNFPLTVRLVPPTSWVGKKATVRQNAQTVQPIFSVTDTLFLHLLPNETPYSVIIEQ